MEEVAFEMTGELARTQKIQVQSGVVSNSHVTMAGTWTPSWNQAFFPTTRPEQLSSRSPVLNPAVSS